MRHVFGSVETTRQDCPVNNGIYMLKVPGISAHQMGLASMVIEGMELICHAGQKSQRFHRLDGWCLGHPWNTLPGWIRDFKEFTYTESTA